MDRHHIEEFRRLDRCSKAVREYETPAYCRASPKRRASYDQRDPRRIHCNYLKERKSHQDVLCPQVDVDGRQVKRFTSATLMGNWVEERCEYVDTPHAHNSTYRTDFRPVCGPTVDVSLRRKAKLEHENGLPLHLLFHHHGDRYFNNTISLYDEHINRREREAGQSFPEERDWHVSAMEWRPEHIDYPLMGDATNWGLLEHLKRRWARTAAEEALGRTPLFNSIYETSYNEIRAPAEYQLTRYATPSSRSMSNNPTDKINKNMAYSRSNQPDLVPTNRAGMAPGVCEPRHPPVMLHN